MPYARRSPVLPLWSQNFGHDMQCKSFANIEMNGIGAKITGATGGLLDGNRPFICGGLWDVWNSVEFIHTDKCHLISINSTRQARHSMTRPRFQASSLVSKGDSLLVMGGFDGKTALSSTEYVHPDLPPKLGPFLTFGSGWSRMCTARINDSLGLLTGGLLDLSPTNRVLWIDPANRRFQDGPRLSMTRSGHACATVQQNGVQHVVVVGGETM